MHFFLLHQPSWMRAALNSLHLCSVRCLFMTTSGVMIDGLWASTSGVRRAVLFLAESLPPYTHASTTTTSTLTAACPSYSMHSVCHSKHYIDAETDYTLAFFPLFFFEASSLGSAANVSGAFSVEGWLSAMIQSRLFISPLTCQCGRSTLNVTTEGGGV